MRHNIPGLHELLALDAVARHGSLRQAAQALSLTSSAVSKQLSQLEACIGHALVQRTGRILSLTPAGRHYWHEINEPLQALAAATFAARTGGDGGVLTLACVPTFLTRWLIPRLPALATACPGLTLSFSHHLAPDATQFPAGIDLAIRYGSGQWPGMCADYIAGREFVAVCAPAYRPPGRTALAAATLLHHHEAPLAWARWAEVHAATQLNTLAGPRFVQYSALVQAALSGLGVALVPHILVQGELAAGNLVLAAGGEVEIDHCHYLCYPAAALERPTVQAFRNWLLDAARQD